MASSDQSRAVRNSSLVVLVTGGNGFLGGHIVNALLQEKQSGLLKNVVDEVRVFDTVDTVPEHSKFSGKVIKGDITDKESVRAACAGVDAVIHCATVVTEGLFPGKLMERVNVDGTRTLLDVCLEDGAPTRVIVAGSVTAAMGETPNNDSVEEEGLPEPDQVISGEYGRTKNLTDRLVRSYGGRVSSDGRSLQTCVLRLPPLFGDGDAGTGVGIALKTAKSLCGFLPVVNSGSALCQFGYAGNVAYGFLSALRALVEKPGKISGQAFYVCDDMRPQPFSEFITPFLNGCGYRIAPVAIPFSLAYYSACVAEAGMRAASIFTNVSSSMSLSKRNLRMIKDSRVFSDAKARQEIGYSPPYSHQKAIERCLPFYYQQTHE